MVDIDYYRSSSKIFNSKFNGKQRWVDGKQVTSLDQIGLAQKGGPVVSHLQIDEQLPETASRIAEGGADAYLVFDVVAGVATPNLARAAADRSY